MMEQLRRAGRYVTELYDTLVDAFRNRRATPVHPEQDVLQRLQNASWISPVERERHLWDRRGGQ